ncbi:MAG: hypothetical protein JSR55_14545 [Proteobacteria bacterium]|nr:hypothetical protein [Pseudomonadota bacterium]
MENISTSFFEFIFLRAALTLGIFALLAILGWQAWKLENWFNNLEIEDFRKRGKPTTPQGLDKRIEEAAGFRWKQLRKTALNLLMLLLLVVVIPTYMFFSIVQNYPRLAPGHIGFIVSGQLAGSLTSEQTKAFTSTQFVRGTLLDTVEIFDVDIASIDYRRTDIPITMAVFVYRVFIGLFAAGFFLGALRFAFLLIRETPGLRELRWRRSIGGQIARS